MTGEIMNKHQLAETQRRIREDNTFWQARVNELKEENERLMHEVEATAKLQTWDEIKCEELRAALKPFSDIAGEMFARNWNREHIVIELGTPDGPRRLYFGDFHAARRALGDNPHD